MDQIGLFDMILGKNYFLKTKNRRNYAVDFNSAGTQLLSCGDDNVTKQWNLNIDPPKIIRSFSKSNNLIMWSTFSPNGEQVASVGRDVLVHLHDAKKGTEINRLVGHENTIYRVEYSPNGKQLFTASADASVKMWDLETQTELFSLHLPTNSGWPIPLWDFDFNCTQSSDDSVGQCWLAVPLFRGKLVLYDLGKPYTF